MAAGLEGHAAGGELGHPGPEGPGRLLVRDPDPGAPVDQEAGQGRARPLEADDEDVPAAKFHAYLNFRVDRLNRAKIRPRIQKRTTTRLSGQPDNSKW